MKFRFTFLFLIAAISLCQKSEAIPLPKWCDRSTNLGAWLNFKAIRKICAEKSDEDVLENEPKEPKDKPEDEQQKDELIIAVDDFSEVPIDCPVGFVENNRGECVKTSKSIQSEPVEYDFF